MSGKCQVCNKRSDSRCSLCRQAWYCCREHQKQDWEGHKITCTRKKYGVEIDPESGHPFLQAQEDIRPDTLILKEKPLLLATKLNAVDFTPNPVCVGCFKEIITEEEEEEDDNDDDDDETSSSSSSSVNQKKECGKCTLPLCSQECGASSHFHKSFECKFISEGKGLGEDEGLDKKEIQIEAGGERSSASLKSVILRNLLYLRALLLKSFSPLGWEQFLSLPRRRCRSEEEDTRNLDPHPSLSRVSSLLQGILEAINHPEINQECKPDVHKILDILDTNVLHFANTPAPTDDSNKSKEGVEVSFVFPTFSMIEHSCIPNLKYYLVRGGGGGSDKKKKKSSGVFELVCRSSPTQKLKKGERLAVSYANLIWNTEKRNEFLKKEKGGMECGCRRCEDPYEGGTNFSTIICMQEGCGGWAVPSLPVPSSTPEMQWKCTKCLKITPSWHVRKVDTRLCEMVAKTPQTLPNYRRLLKKIEEVTHPDYYLTFVVNHSLLQLYGEKDEEENPSEDENVRMQNPKMLEDKVNLGNRLLQMIKKLDPYTVKLNVYVGVIYYEMQSAILAMGGGEVDDDFLILRNKPETVKLAKLYLQKCIDCFKYEGGGGGTGENNNNDGLEENRLRKLALKKMEYLDFIIHNKRVQHH